MYIQKIHIENFRLLKNVDIVLDKSLTLIVGKNNTGKTSVAHLLQSIINEKKNYIKTKNPCKAKNLQHTLGIETCFTCVVPGRGRDSLF